MNNKIIPGKRYKNVMTGACVNVFDVCEKEECNYLLVWYRKELGLKEFMKPMYVFSQTYKPLFIIKDTLVVK